MRLIDRSEQGTMTVIQYFSFLNTHWQRVDHLQDYHPIYPSDSKGYQKLLEKHRVVKFLQGLNSEYEVVRSRVLGLDPLTTL